MIQKSNKLENKKSCKIQKVTNLKLENKKINFIKQKLNVKI